MKPRLLKLKVNLILLTSLWACNHSKTDEAIPEQENGTYFTQVKEIINLHCLSCHNPNGNWEGRPVRLDSDSAIAAQHLSIKQAVADPISPTNKRMPEGSALSSSDISIIVKWYQKGGKTND